MAEFVKITGESNSFDGRKTTIYFNLDSILRVEDPGVDGEPVGIVCPSGDHNYRPHYWVIGDEARQLIEHLRSRCDPH